MSGQSLAQTFECGFELFRGAVGRGQMFGDDRPHAIEQAGAARPVTVEDLLLHTAGLSHRSSREYREARVRSRAISLPQFIDNIVRVPLRSDPGTRYRYSAAPTVLGRLVEIWSAQPFDEFLQERVLRPLGMTDTGFWATPVQRGRLTTVYSPSDEGTLRPYEIEEIPFSERPELLEGAVGLLSTVPDFLRFSQMLLNGGELGGVRILRESTVEMMTGNGLPDAILQTRRGGTGWALTAFCVGLLVSMDRTSAASVAEAHAVTGPD